MEKVSDIMTPDVVCAKVPGVREDVFQLVHEHKHFGFPVVKKEKSGESVLVGIVTRTDLMRKPDENQIALLMTRDVISLNKDASLEETASVILNNRIRRIPIVEDDKIVGIVTIADFVHKAITRSDITDPIEKYMKREIVTVYEGTPLPVALNIMELANVELMPVLNDASELSGVVSKADLIASSEVISERKISSMSAESEGDSWSWDAIPQLVVTKKELRLPSKPVSEIMIKNVISTFKQTPINDCAKLMRKHDIDQIPVMTIDGELVGIIRDTDLLQAYLDRISKK
ncbi:MAG: CBS domain-containing protein [Promethearchaeota archaeon]